MKYLLPLGIALLMTGIFAKSILLHHQHIIPADTLVGLYHPYIDTFSSEFPRGFPYKNPLITDPIRQQYPWKSLVMQGITHGQLPLWNPYNGLGTPLLANFQSGVFYPINIVFLFLPFINAWDVYMLLQPLLGILFMYLFLRSIKVSELGSILGGVVFAFCGFSVSWMSWGNISHTLVWLPLILYAKEKLLEKWSIQFGILFLFAELSALFAGHLQVWFYMLLVTNSYLFLRIFMKIFEEKKKVTFSAYIRTYMPFLIAGVGMLLVGLTQLIPTLQFIQVSGRGVDQAFTGQEGWFIPWQHLVQFIAPDYFGNPATGNYWGVWNYGEFIGYIGIVPLLLVVSSLIVLLPRRDWRVWFFALIIFIAFLFALPTPLAKIPFTMHLPLLSSSQPTRLLSLIDMSLAVLAGIGLDSLFVASKKEKITIGSLFVLLIVVAWASVFSLTKFHIGMEDISIAKRNLILPTILGFIALVTMLVTEISKKKFFVFALGILIIGITSFDLLRFSWKFIPFTDQRFVYPSSPVITYLQQNVGMYRVLAVDDRILPPNANDMYHVQFLTLYDPLYALRFGQFVAMMERRKPDIQTPFGFNRIITPKNYTSPFIDLLGVKYILSLDPIINDKFRLVASEGATKIYENTKVYPRAFLVKDVTPATSVQQDVEETYALQDKLLSTAVVEHHVVASYASGSAMIQQYSSEQIVVRTHTETNGFLVLTDQYYPSWHAYVDGKEEMIYAVDVTLRGVEVPKGDHTVVFKDRL